MGILASIFGNLFAAAPIGPAPAEEASASQAQAGVPGTSVPAPGAGAPELARFGSAPTTGQGLEGLDSRWIYFDYL